MKISKRTLIHSHLLLFILLLSLSNAVQAQHKKTLKEKLEEATNNMIKAKETVDAAAGLIMWTKGLIYSSEVFTKVSKMNTPDFNKNVTVVKAGTSDVNPADNIPAKQVTKPKIVNGEFTNLNWHPAVYFDSLLFPSAIIGLASFKRESPSNLFEAIRRPLGFNIISDKSNIPLKYEIECTDKTIFDKVSGYILYEQDHKFTDYNVDVPWNYTSLVNNETPKPISLIFRLYDEDGNKVEKLATVTLRSINDCIYNYKGLDLKFLFASYVQEDDLAEIDAITQQAQSTKTIDAFLGYQGDAAYVDRQVAAIWRVLHDKNFFYNDVTTSSIINGNDSLYAQTVRTFHKALHANSANCVDGTVVFASILRKIHIDPVMVMVTEKDNETGSLSGHCFLAYAIEPNADITKDASKFHFLETTMLSNTKVYNKSNQQTDAFAGAKTLQQKNQAYVNIFQAARDYAEYEISNKIPHTEITVSYLVDISLWRNAVAPLPIGN